VKSAKEKLGYLHKVGVQVATESEVQAAIANGADVIMFDGVSADELKRLATVAKELSASVMIEYSGPVTPANVREYAEAGAQLIRIEALTSSAPATKIAFNVQPF
jgi:nicotinate-nucleotide pyrophosphorylase (carboxylating)